MQIKNQNTSPNMSQSDSCVNRDFKGIWIPREIWLNPELSAQEKCLWAEIHSLFNRERGGCYASNEYLMKFMNVKERMLQFMISNLKAHGLLVQVSFNGRERIIKAIIPPEDFRPCGAEVQNIAPLGCNKLHPSDAINCTPIYKGIDTRLDTSIDNTPPTPASGEAANAADVGLIPSKSSDFSKPVKDLVLDVVNVLQDANADYRKPKDPKPMLAQCRLLVEEDKREPDRVLEVLRWAVRDNEMRGTFKGWSKIMYGKNGLASLRKNFASIAKEMQSREKRKFAPSSNDERSLEKYKEWSKTSL